MHYMKNPYFNRLAQVVPFKMRALKRGHLLVRLDFAPLLPIPLVRAISHCHTKIIFNQEINFIMNSCSQLRYHILGCSFVFSHGEAKDSSSEE